MSQARRAGRKSAASKKVNSPAHAPLVAAKVSPKPWKVLVALGVVGGLAFGGSIFLRGKQGASQHVAATAASVATPSTTNKVNSKHADHAEERVSAADVMMGGDPRKQFTPAANALQIKGDASSGSKETHSMGSMQSVGTEGLITLDPVCETIETAMPKLAPGNPDPSTKKMAERLAAHYAKATPESMAYLSDRVATVLEHRVTNATEANEKFRLQFNLAIQQINSSRPDAALNTFATMEKLIAESGGQLDERTQTELRLRKGIAFFRLGEQENCLATHNADSCVFPLKPKAYHLLPRGSQGAITLFSAHLAEHPNDYSTRWLLNLAHMTLGEYPDKVNPQYLIPPERFASEYKMPRFYDVSEGLGVDANDLAGGVIVDDFDNDGLYDIVISAWDQKGQLRYFHNEGTGYFKERTSEAGLIGEVGALNIVQTDYNNDGLLDIWLMRGGWLGKAGRIPASLLRNNGNGAFIDVTEEVGLLRMHPTMACRWFDYDGDGWLDLFIGNESMDPKDPDWCELYHNNGNGTFTECAKESGIRLAGFVKGVACGDYDNDGRPDLYLSIRGGRHVLFHNDGPGESAAAPMRAGWRFSETTAKAGLSMDQFLSFGTFFFDYDNDGWEDLMVFGYYLQNGVGDVAADYMGLPNAGAKPKLYHNNRDGTFSDVTADAHLNRICHTMGHNYGDLDSDGWLDFYCGTGDPDFRTLIPNRMFRNAEGKFFQDVTTATGTGHIQKGHGVAFADLNDDGYQDVYSTLGGAYAGDFARNALFLNPGSTNHFLKLKLVGTKANHFAVGARIKVTLQTPAGTRELHRVVSSGGCFGGNPFRQEIGLGDATSVVAVDIRWPGSDTRQTVAGLQLNRSYEIYEGEKKAVELQLHPVNIDHAKHEEKQARLFEAAGKN